MCLVILHVACHPVLPGSGKKDNLVKPMLDGDKAVAACRLRLRVTIARLARLLAAVIFLAFAQDLWPGWCAEPAYKRNEL
jgi:hypothetical protein